MRISHAHRFIFFARPKTGSSSVRQFLDPYTDLHPVKNFLERTPENPFYPHMRPIEVRDEFTRRGWDFAGYTKFVFARNPWARSVSLYRHIQQSEGDAGDFPDWVRGLANGGPGAGGDDSQRWRKYGAYSLENYVRDEEGRPLVDHVLRLEDLDAQLVPFLARLGLEGLEERVIPHSNDRARGESYTTYYDDATRNRVTELYREEVARFGYAFGL